jgi:DNA ligase (NAD+)
MDLLDQYYKEKLEQKIHDANTSYAAGIPFITDLEYDQLWQQLYNIDPTNPLLYHTAQQNYTGGNLVQHKYQVFGTHKAFNMDDLKPFLTRFGDQPLLIEPKYDGCAAVITQTSSGITITLEGDGKSGRDITYLKPYIIYPFHLRHFQTVEILIPWQSWNPAFGKNPRNVVAGWLARKNEAPPIKMIAIPHNFGNLNKDYKYTGDLESFSILLLSLYSEWSKIFPMDGLMIKPADEKIRLIAGNNGQVNNWSIAWKPPIQTAETIVTDIEWNVSRQGRIIPTVIYEPIELCGSINSRATGNNAQWIGNKKINIGSKIIVGKAGEIIPRILEVIETSTILTEDQNSVPTHCPKCGEHLKVDGVHLICNGPKCITQLITSLAYFYSHKGLMIDGLAAASFEKILANQKLYNLLSTKPWAILDPVTYNISAELYTVLGDAIYKNTIKSIEQINKTKTIAHFISGLGLPGISYKTALRLCQYIKSGSLI